MVNTLVTVRQTRCRSLGLSRWAAAGLMAWFGHSVLYAFMPCSRMSASQTLDRIQQKCVVRHASVTESLQNPVKTVSDTLADFYKAYPQPPVLPMYRPFLVDFITQTHLVKADSRWAYDGLFALGLWEYYSALMGNYDKIVGVTESEKIWTAFVSAVGMDPDQVKADAEVVANYAKSTSPAQILEQIEGTSAVTEEKVGTALETTKTNMWSTSKSVGLFKLMEYSGSEVTKANVEEWAAAMKAPTGKISSDFETYKANKDKLQKAEEMLREIEIREKKKLAERLEEKAKALAAKAAAKSQENEEGDK